MKLVTGLSIEYYYGLSGLAALRSNWDRIYESCRNKVFYNDWRWHHALQNHLLPTDACYLYVSNGDQSVAILPLHLVVRGRAPLVARVITFPYHVAVDLSDMLVAGAFADTPLLGPITDHLRSEPPWPWDFLQLTQFTERSCFWIQAQQFDAACVPVGHSAYVTSDSANLSDRLSKKQIKNVRRHLRNAETALGDCVFETVTTPAQLAAKYEVFLELESSGWKGDDGTKSAIALRPDARAFYGEVLRMFGETGNAVVNILSFGGKAAAAQIGLKTTERLNLLKIGFDEAFREYGPGAVALLKCIDAEAQNVRELSLVTCPPWSQRWHFIQEEKYVVEVFNSTPYARLLHLARRLQRSIKDLVTSRREAKATEVAE